MRGGVHNAEGPAELSGLQDLYQETVVSRNEYTHGTMRRKRRFSRVTAHCLSRVRLGYFWFLYVVA